jgi:CheY-like chemotaxis protein
MIKLQNDNEVIMVDDSDLDLKIAQRCFAKSKVKNKFVPLMSAASLFAYLEDVKTKKARVPALILLDINMPGIDGHEALAKVRRDASFNESPFIAMFSHSSLESDRERAMAIGANGYQVKPISSLEYIDFFNSLIS